MIRIERHISDLLLENDCISIPGLGGLVAQYFRSEINPGTNILRPPSKRISFHEELTANSHLLITRISDSERISLAETNQLIEKTVKDWQLTLAEGDSIKLEGIGRFYQDKKGAVCFNQSLEANFNLDSFGLDMFRATAIQRDVQIKAAVTNAIHEHVSPKAKGEGNRKAFPYWRAAAVFAGIGALLTVGFFKTEVNLNEEFMANFNPLHYSRAIEVPVVSEKTLPDVANESTEKQEHTVQYEDVATDIEPETSKTANSLEELITPASTVLPYQVIVGSFKDVANAQDLILRLQRMGYDPQIIDDSSSFSKVSIQGFENRSAAASALKSYKTRVNKGAWIYTAN
jgi:hypothetical protein